MSALNIIDDINKFSNKVTDFIIAHQYSGALWIAIFLIGILVFVIVYNALNKN